MTKEELSEIEKATQRSLNIGEVAIDSKEELLELIRLARLGLWAYEHGIPTLKFYRDTKSSIWDESTAPPTLHPSFGYGPYEAGKALAALPTRTQAETKKGGRMSKHTPRPWRFDPDNQNIYANGMVAQTFGHVHNGEKLANARLIAAAPDLLEALKDILYALSNPICAHKVTGSAVDLDSIRESIQEIAEDAIAKAEAP